MKSNQKQDIPVRSRASTARVILLTTCVLLVTAGDANGAAKPAQGRFGPGELMWFDLSFGLIPAGYARIAVGADTLLDGATTWPIVVDYRTNQAVSRIFEVKERFVTHWDPNERRTRGFDHYKNSDGVRGFLSARLDPASGQARTREFRLGKAPSERTREIGDVKHDFGSAIFWLRHRPLVDGELAELTIFNGRRPIGMTARVDGRETIDVLGTQRAAVRVRLEVGFEGKFESRAMYIWYSDDEAHVPLRMRADLALGSIRVELTKYEPGLSR